MQSITIKLDEPLFSDFEKARQNQYYTKTEFIKEAIRQKILDDKIRTIRKITELYKGNIPQLTAKMKAQILKESEFELPE